MSILWAVDFHIMFSMYEADHVSFHAHIVSALFPIPSLPWYLVLVLIANVYLPVVSEL